MTRPPSCFRNLTHTFPFLLIFLCYALGALFTFPPHSLSSLVLSLTRSLAILSPYSSYCACGHSPWVFALPGLILLLPVISFCLLLIDASCAAALLSFVLGQRLLLTLSFSLQCRLLAFLSLHFQICSPLFVFLLSPACTQIYPLTPPPLLDWTWRWRLIHLCVCFFRNPWGVPPPLYGLLGRPNSVSDSFLG